MKRSICVVLVATARAYAADGPEDVTVGGRKASETGGSAHSLTEKQLLRFRNDDPHKVLMQIPGVYVRGEDGFGLRPNIGIRGGNSDRSKKVTLLEDGILFAPAPYSAPAAYYFPNMSRMRNVRVLKGPSSIANGPQTVGGAIDLLTHEIPATRTGVFDLGYGSYGYNKLHARFGTSDEHTGFLLEALHLGSDGFKTLDRVGGDTGFSRNEVMLKVGHTLNPDADVVQRFEAKLQYADEVSNETYLGLTDEDFRTAPYRRYVTSQLDKMQWKRTSMQLSHQATFSRNFAIKTTAYRHDLDRTWRKINGFRGADIYDVLSNPDSNRLYREILAGNVDSTSSRDSMLIGPNNRVFVSQGVQSLFNLVERTGPATHRLQYGLRLHYDSIERNHTQEGFLVRYRSLVPDGAGIETTANNRAYTTAVAMHAQDAIEYKALTVTPGIRLELIRSISEDQLAGTRKGRALQVALPGLAAHLKATDDLALFGGVHKGFSPPSPGDQTAAPESSVNYELGARVGRRNHVEAVGFANNYSNFTSICTFSSGCAPADIDKQFSAGGAFIAGIELLASAEVKLTNALTVPLRATYTFTSARFLSSFRSQDPQFGSVRRGDELPYIPLHQASASVGLESERYAVNLGGTYVGDMRERAGQGETKPNELTDPYFLLDVSLQAHPAKWITLYVNGKNMLNSEYIVSRRPFGARPGAPLTVISGMTLTY
jgi:Fe(3+) dicitrate transport protein